MNNNIRGNVTAVLILIFTFLLPFGGDILGMVLLGIGVSWIVEWNWKEKFARWKTHACGLLPVLLFLVYLAGMSGTTNMSQGWLLVGHKAGLVLLPLILTSVTTNSILNSRNVQYAFAIGCFIVMIVCFANALRNYYGEIDDVAKGLVHDTYINREFFFAQRLSFLIHPSYAAMYVDLACFFLLRECVNGWKDMKRLGRSFHILTIVALMLFVFFLASRMGMIVLFLLLFGSIIYFIIRSKRLIAGSSLIVGGILIFFIAYKTSDVIASRFDYAIRSVTSTTIDKTSSESSTVRLLIWGTARDIISKNWVTGVGTGDVEDVLLENYRTDGMTGALEHKLNAHDQFLQTFIGVGIAGFLLLCAMLLLPAIAAFRKSRYLTLIFLIIFLLNITVESMLEIHAGLFFFSFFFPLLPVLETAERRSNRTTTVL